MRSVQKWYADLAPRQKLGARLLAAAFVLFAMDSAIGDRLGIYGFLILLGSAVPVSVLSLVGTVLLLTGRPPSHPQEPTTGSDLGRGSD
jgi:hypothetical protein